MNYLRHSISFVFTVVKVDVLNGKCFACDAIPMGVSETVGDLKERIKELKNKLVTLPEEFELYPVGHKARKMLNGDKLGAYQHCFDVDGSSNTLTVRITTDPHSGFYYLNSNPSSILLPDIFSKFDIPLLPSSHTPAHHSHRFTLDPPSP